MGHGLVIRFLRLGNGQVGVGSHSYLPVTLTLFHLTPLQSSNDFYHGMYITEMLACIKAIARQVEDLFSGVKSSNLTRMHARDISLKADPMLARFIRQKYHSK